MAAQNRAHAVTRPARQGGRGPHPIPKNPSPSSRRHGVGQFAGVCRPRHCHGAGARHAGGDLHRHGGAARATGQQRPACAGAADAQPLQICAGQRAGALCLQAQAGAPGQVGRRQRRRRRPVRRRSRRRRAKRPRHETEARMQFYATMAQALATGAWDGDRDSLRLPPEPEVWSPVAGRGQLLHRQALPGCLASCTYYDKRKELVGAQVIVANHDLLLSVSGRARAARAGQQPAGAGRSPPPAADRSRSNSRAAWTCRASPGSTRLASRGLRIGPAAGGREIADIPEPRGPTAADAAETWRAW